MTTRSRCCSRSRARRSSSSGSRRRTATRRSTRRRTMRCGVLALVGRTDVPVAVGADRPLVRELARRRPRPRREWPRRPRAAAAASRAGRAERRRLPRRARDAGDRARPRRAADEHRAAARHRGVSAERIVLMGGAIAEGNMTPAAEFNIWADPEAAQRVFHSGLDVTMIGLDVTHGAPDAGVGRPLPRRRPRRARSSPSWSSSSSSTTRGPTAGTAPDPRRGRARTRVPARDGHDRADERRGRARVGALTRGRTVADRWHRTDREPNANVGVGIDGEAFFELLLERIATYG